ncbi:MAG: phenazine biosynthesis protein PhzF family [Caulobacteraceae bacterium]|nr:phenazine biosynthesis protein PhzF family [Caulobacteraceae bacterium]
MRQWLVDAFASGPFRGNPAAVVEPFDAWPDDAWMQALAQENNQAETAFLLRTADPARFGLRWFTPTLEIPLCGHATLASGHVLIGELGNDAERIVFDTRSGPLTVTATGADRYEMDFPANPPRRTPVPEGLARALGVEPLEVWAGAYLVAIVKNEAMVRELQPDLARLEKIAGEATGGRGNVSVAAVADEGAPYDVVSRFFAPGSGIPEDPATGSVHCILAPLFSERLGRDRLRFHQAFPGRGGDIATQTIGPRVILAGRAVTVIEGWLRL